VNAVFPSRLPSKRDVRSWACVLLLVVAPASWADSDNDRVADVLGKMSTAMRELNYRGLFTFEFGSSLDSYKIVHRVANGKEHERPVARCAAYLG